MDQGGGSGAGKESQRARAADPELSPAPPLLGGHSYVRQHSVGERAPVPECTCTLGTLPSIPGHSGPQTSSHERSYLPAPGDWSPGFQSGKRNSQPVSHSEGKQDSKSKIQELAVF